MTTVHHSAEQAKLERIRAMGEDLGALYDALWQQVAYLHTKWEAYASLFGAKETRIEILNSASPQFFRIVQDLLWEEVLLHIARLTDSPASVGKPNLSIRRLPEAVEHEATREKVASLVEDALTASDFCRDWRNRHIAHRDLDRALSPHAHPLKPASREKVHLAIEALDAVLNAVALHYQDTTTFFDSGGESSSAMSLLYLLDAGLKARKARSDRLRSGTYEPSDHEHQSL